jgi:glycosyltransferase involved in cell wall biosynthesis
MTTSPAVSTLFLFHTPSNVGYAMAAAEPIFLEVGLDLAAGDASRVHFGYKDLQTGPPRNLQGLCNNFVAFDSADPSPSNLRNFAEYVRKHRIKVVWIYDIQPVHPLFQELRKAGAKSIISYWGAPISSVMPYWKLTLKRLEVLLSRSKASGVVFQSQAMANLALYGRGVPARMIDVIYSGVDPALYVPKQSAYVYDTLNIPREKKIVVYAGHMEPRKGLPTLVEAAIELLHRRERRDVSFVICGNKNDETKAYEAMYAGLGISHSIHFAGYRSDLREIYPSCYCGVIPSSGWDSFPRSPIEMAACGLPVVASRLQGLPESVLDGKTGLLFEPGNSAQLADCLERLLDQPELAKEYGHNGRIRCENELSKANQIRRMCEVCRKWLG